MPQYPLENGSLLDAKVCWTHSSCGLMQPQIRAQSYIRGGRAGFQAHLVIWPTTLEQWTTCATVHGGPAKPNWNSFHHDEWDHILSIAPLTTQKQGQGKVPAVLCKFPSWVSHSLQTSYLKTSVFPSVETSSCVSWRQCPPDDGPRHQKTQSTLQVEGPLISWMREPKPKVRSAMVLERTLGILTAPLLLLSSFNFSLREHPKWRAQQYQVLHQYFEKTMRVGFLVTSTFCSYSPPLLLKSHHYHQVSLSSDRLCIHQH